MNPEQVEVEFIVWNKNTPFLYDLIISHPLKWPSLTVHWIPSSPTPATPTSAFNVHKLVLDTQTNGGAIDFLMIVDATFPTLAAESNIAAKTDDAIIPKRGMKLILNLCLSDGFDTFPTLLCADGCSMIDRRMNHCLIYPLNKTLEIMRTVKPARCWMMMVESKEPGLGLQQVLILSLL